MVDKNLFYRRGIRHVFAWEFTGTEDILRKASQTKKQKERQRHTSYIGANVWA